MTQGYGRVRSPWSIHLKSPNKPHDHGPPMSGCLRPEFEASGRRGRLFIAIYFEHFEHPVINDDRVWGNFFLRLKRSPGPETGEIVDFEEILYSTFELSHTGGNKNSHTAVLVAILLSGFSLMRYAALRRRFKPLVAYSLKGIDAPDIMSMESLDGGDNLKSMKEMLEKART
jgi:hypothetical protein